MVQFETERLTILADEKTGYLRSIVGKNDPYAAEWVLADSDWGQTENFITDDVTAENGILTVSAHHVSETLTMTVEKKVENGKYTECYAVKNIGKYDFFCHPDTFGILFPFNTIVLRQDETDQLDRVCTAHVWCGGDTAWIYGHKLGGNGPYLIVNLEEGAIADYSIRLEALLSRNNGDYRGDILMDPQHLVIAPGETRSFRFAYEMTEKQPLDYLIEDTDSLIVQADKNTVFSGEEARLSIHCRRGTAGALISADGVSLPVTSVGNHAEAVFSANEPGERCITVSCGGKATFIRLNVIEPLDVILKKRAHFISEKQQYHREGSAYDGAYLTYDDVEKTLICEPWGDRNCGHERIAMGVIVALALQNEYDEALDASLKQYLAFVRRELFDEETGTVFTESGKDNGNRRRFFNDPWIAILFRETYRYNGDRTYLRFAFDIMDQYFRLFGRTHDGTAVEVYELCELLEKEGMNDESRILQEHLIAYLDHFLSSGTKIDKFTEVGYCHETADIRAKHYYDAYRHTGNAAYKERGDFFYKSAASFYSFQPDFHLNGVSVRNWDAFWFGKKKQFGDTFPHYWSCDLADAVFSHSKALGTEEDALLMRNTLLGNLCLYRTDGFAANSYLYPYHIRFHRAPDNQAGFVPDGAFYGKTYDEFANDQDWALYFALKILPY